ISVTKTEVTELQRPAVVDHNLYYCAAGAEVSAWAGVSGTIKGFHHYVNTTGNDQHSRFLDPHFVNTAAHNFRLQTGSPALVAGTIDELPVGELDLDGSPRVKSGKIDLGSYQKP